MTLAELQVLLTGNPGDVVKALQVSSFDIPKWSDLKKEYDPMEHSIWDETKYPAKFDDKNNDDFKRTALGLQKLAVNRVSQSMFATPVKRIYNYDKESEQAQQAVDILEQMYRTNNYIDAENIERAKQLNSSCEIVTIWRVYEKPNIIEGLPSKYKLNHKTYSSKDGYNIFAQVDENDELLVVSILYTDTADKEHMEVFINGEKPEYRRYDNLGEWALNTEVSKPLEVFPVVHSYIDEPIWGGEAGTNLVEQLEEMESYQGLYIKRNALPTFTLDVGEVEDGVKSDTTETSSDARRVIKVGKGGKMDDVTWEGAEKAITGRYNRIRNAFFEQIQVPDTSFANMINSNTSAENKELLFADAKAKARDLGGEWERLFSEELSLIVNMAKIIFPSLVSQFETISIRSVIQPYSIKSKKENAEFVAIGGSAMSMETKVRELGVVDDVTQEVETIQEEAGTSANLGL